MILLLAIAAVTLGSAFQTPLMEMRTFSSVGGELKVLLVATQATAPVDLQVNSVVPTVWVYEACLRYMDDQINCTVADPPLTHFLVSSWRSTLVIVSRSVS